MKTGISIITPSSGAMSNYPKRVEYGRNFLQAQGFEVFFEKNAFKSESYYSANIEERISDINDALENSNVDLIMASIGGHNSNQLINKLDYKKISQCNKLFCGYSDITCLLLAIYSKTKNIVLHGPTFLPEICEFPETFDYTWKYFVEAMNRKRIEYKEPKYEVKEFVDWKIQENQFIERKKEKNNDKWKIAKSGKAKGKIIGGNLSSILTIIGTEYLPIEIFNDKILFVEDVNTSIAEFDSFMQSLKLHGIFKKIKGLIIGKFKEKEINMQMKKFTETFFRDNNYPIIYNIDLGHTDPMITIPIGAETILDCNSDIKFIINGY